MASASLFLASIVIRHTAKTIGVQIPFEILMTRYPVVGQPCLSSTTESFPGLFTVLEGKNAVFKEEMLKPITTKTVG